MRTAGALQPRYIAQHLHRLPRRPAQRMEDLARVDHALQPRAIAAGALHRKQQ
jgi:hypothetical protein